MKVESSIQFFDPEESHKFDTDRRAGRKRIANYFPAFNRFVRTLLAAMEPIEFA